jgi:hypothetical protein
MALANEILGMIQIGNKMKQIDEAIKGSLVNFWKV